MKGDRDKRKGEEGNENDRKKDQIFILLFDLNLEHSPQGSITPPMFHRK